MVEFFDEVTQQNISYHIDAHLLKRWDKLRRNRLVKKDEDRVYIVDGRERVGKSVFALQQAKYLNPKFSLDNVCFTPDEFLNQIRTAEKGSVIVFDEAFRGLSSKGSQSKINKQIVQALMEMGQRNLIVFIVLPTFFLLEIYAAVLRSEALFHIYKDKNGRRAFRIYNYDKKSWLWRNGKKKGFDYSKPRVKVRGRFYGKYAIDEESYRKKKLKSLREMGEGISNIEDKYQYYYYMLVQILKEKTKLSYVKMVKLMGEKGVEVSYQNISRICKEIKPNPPILPLK